MGEHFNAKISDFVSGCPAYQAFAVYSLPLSFSLQGFFELKTKCNFYSKLRAQCTEPQVYMAPEAMEKDEFTAAADVYSFGE